MTLITTLLEILEILSIPSSSSKNVQEINMYCLSQILSLPLTYINVGVLICYSPPGWLLTLGIFST